MRNQCPELTISVDIAQRRSERLQRFHRPFRDRIAALTCCAPEAEDVAESFPGLLVALVSDFGTRDARATAFATILAGGSLKVAAEQLRLPLWLRRMPPEAFREPLGNVPGEGPFATKINNFIPRQPNGAGDWLELVSAAGAACSSEFALWVAKHCSNVAPSRRRFTFLSMAAWAWHAGQPNTTGHRLIEKPWSPKMGLRRATGELLRWNRRMELAAVLAGGIEDAWLKEGCHDGFAFVALRTIDDFVSESRMMSNCLDQYSERLATGLIRVFSVREVSAEGAQRRVADIEVGPVVSNASLPSVVQFKGAGNRPVSSAVRDAADQWLLAQRLEQLRRRPGPVQLNPQASRDARAALWQPYLEWLPNDQRGAFQQSLMCETPNVSGGPVTLAIDPRGTRPETGARRVAI